MARSVRCSILVLALAAFAVPGFAASIDPESLRVAYEKFVLPNGLTVLVHEDHAVPIVAVNLWYHVGSRDEKRGRTGFAHLFEHFFFNGSENHPHGFREAMDELGANNRNGTTSTDRTNFFEDVPVGALERTLYLEADRMGFLAGNLSAEMLERERGVVSNEKRQGENQPYGRVFTRMVEAVYPASHPYSWSTIGSLDDLAAATLDDVKSWYETYYGPNNCTLSLAGDITVARAKEFVTRYFGGIPPGPPLPRYATWVPRLERDLYDTMADRVPQARVYRVWHVPAWGTRELGHLNLLAGVLSGAKSARLDRRLIYEKEFATQVSAGVWEKEIGSSFIVQATVKPGVDPGAVESEIDAVLAELLE
ncbi:MAG: M16 family metallopeptidase, partial [Myxococcota bacterium]